MDKLYSAKELSEVTGMAKQTLYRLVREGKVKCYKIGARILFNLDDFIVEEKETADE